MIQFFIRSKENPVRFPLPFIEKQIAKISSQNSDPGNFADRPKEEVENIALRSGRATDRNFAPAKERASEAGRKGGAHSGADFARRIERARQAGRNLEQETD
ncbi:hypothetical protein RMATCC62417_01455 [Rhizopus microsporus]|nr:hypothetical protein RMATCC62417_01455 [Rhizopus microsporus]